MADLEKESLYNIPNIMDGKGKKLLYVGGSTSRVYLYDDFIEFGYNIDILEIWTENVEFLRNLGYYTIQGDVRNVKNIINCKYDVVVWWHGPEHIKKDELKLTLENLESISNLIVLGCPLNDVIGQNEVGNNPYEEHKWIVQKKDLEELNYNVFVVLRPYYHCNHITAWRFVK